MSRVTSMLARVLPTTIYSAGAQWANAFAGGLGFLFVFAQAEVGALLAVAGAVVAQALTSGIVLVTAGPGNDRAWVRACAVVGAGLARGSLIVVLLWWVGERATLQESVLQILSSVVFTTLWLLSAAAIAQADRDYRDEFAVLFERAVADAEGAWQRGSPWGDARAIAEQERADVQVLLGRVAPEGGPMQGQLEQVARHLHEAIELRVRPASHALWREGEQAAPSLSAGAIVLQAIMVWPGSPAWAAGAAALVGAVGALLGAGIWVAMFTASVIAIVTFSIMRLRARVHDRDRRGRVLRATLMAALVPLNIAFLQLLGVVVGLPPRLGGVVLVGIAAASIAFAVTAVVGLRRAHDDVLREMEELLASGYWREARVRWAYGLQAQDAGTYLHHRVQSDLLSAALQLEMAAHSEDSTLMESTLTSLRERLALAQAEPVPRLSSLASVMAIREDWAGICEVTLDLSEPAHLSDGEWRQVELLVREAVANAVRAGGADQVSVKLVPESDTLRLQVIDNGKRSTANGQGIGSRMLAVLAPSAWKLSDLEAGHCLDVVARRRD